MRQRSAVVLAGVLVAAVAAVPIAGLAATSDQVTQTNNSTASDSTAADSNASVAPGEQLAGVVGVQKAELEGEVDERAYGIEIANATTNDSRAEVVKSRLDSVDRRLAELEEEKRELDAARDESMSEGRYRAEVSALAAQTESVKRIANRSATVAQGLPADVRDANGINVTAIRTLQDQAANLTGPEIAAIARSIAGPDVGGPPGDRGPGGPPERPGQGGPWERPGGPDTDVTDGERTPDSETTDDGTADGQRTDSGPDATPRSGY